MPLSNNTFAYKMSSIVVIFIFEYSPSTSFILTPNFSMIEESSVIKLLFSKNFLYPSKIISFSKA